GRVGEAEAVGVESEVAGGMKARVRHQPEPRESTAGEEARANVGAEAEIGRPDVGGDDPERIAEERQGLGDAARGLERAAVIASLAREGERDHPARAVAEGRDDLLLEPRRVDDDL